jgi:hypothetical protein
MALQEVEDLAQRLQRRQAHAFEREHSAARLGCRQQLADRVVEQAPGLLAPVVGSVDPVAGGAPGAGAGGDDPGAEPRCELEAAPEVRSPGLSRRFVRRHEVPVAGHRRRHDAPLREQRTALRGERVVREAALEEGTVELHRGEAEGGKGVGELAPPAVVGGERAVDGAAVAADAERRAREGAVARDDRERRGRRLERQPAVVADLGQRRPALGEVDAAESRPAVVLPREEVLDMDAANQVAEVANLGRRVEPADDRVREVEVARECGEAMRSASACTPAAASVPS